MSPRTHAQLVTALAEASEVSAVEVGRVLAALAAELESALAKGDRITVAGVGTFEPRARAARTGRNPQTGEELQIPATTVAGFKPAASLKRSLAG